MFLKRLEIVGFKSFADTFEMQFLPGITAVVGPNGAGKSNVADALRWVLGSQSPKQLRSERMEDVIFSGSVERKPQGMAEVMITFDNAGRALDLDFDEVCIARRLFRSGESEYLINGNRCRLMDVTDLIVDRGLGSNGYWILTRNMVKTILSSRPEDRRFLFDEAAGITRYKIQRHRAELKLDSTNEDLERIDDIIGEVSSTVGALKKQVSAFRRFEKAERRISEIRGVMVSRRLREVGELLSAAVLERMALDSRREALSAELAAAEARLAEASTDLEGAETVLEEARESCNQLERSHSSLERELAVVQTRISSVSARIGDADGMRRQQRDRAEELDTAAKEMSRRVEELEGAMQGYRDRASAAASKAEEARRERAEARESLEGARGELTEVRRRISRLEEQGRARLQRRERLAGELETTARRRGDLEERCATLRDSVKAAETGLEEISGRRKNCLESLRDKRERLAALREEDRRLQESKHALEMEKAGGEERLSGLADPVFDRAGDSLAEALSVSSGFEKAVGAYLDGFQDAEPLAAARELSGGDGRRVAITGLPSPPRPRLPEKAVWLPELVEDPEGRYTAILAGGALAPDRSTALRWIEEGIPVDLVTEDGDLLRSVGLARLGVSPASPGTMERRALAEETRKLLAGLEADIASRDEDRRGLLERLERAGEEEAALARDLSELDSEMASAGTRLAGLRESLKETSEELERLESRVPRLEEELLQLDSDGSTGGMEELRKSRADLEARVLERESALEEIGDRLSRLSSEESSAAFDLRGREEELSRLQADAQRLRKDSADAGRRAEESAQRIGELEQEPHAQRGQAGGMQKDLELLQGRRDKAEEARREAAERRAELMQQKAKAQSRTAGLREKMSELRDGASRLEGRISTFEERLAGLRGAPHVLPDAGSRYWSMDDEKLQSNLERQQGYRERLGPVNMLAVKEHEEANNRLEFLEEQRSDLVEARDSLVKAISEINRTAAKRFEKTFSEVRAHFRELFVHLFGGGEADIMPLEAEDPLEGGVQIMARPAGKKLSNVTVLSDGEQALAAVALLFSLYLVKPSPFCVLDELDAPLDDSNIDRFVDLLRRFSRKTQFLVITHNKRTMEAADVLYGVTMQEKGVSSAASVSLEEAGS